MRRDSAVSSHLNDTVRVAGRIDHRSTFKNRVSHGLFDIDVGPCLHSRNRNQWMPVVRRGIDHNLRLLFVDQFTKILINLRRISRQLFLLTLQTFDLLQVDIAECHDFALT